MVIGGLSLFVLAEGVKMDWLKKFALEPIVFKSDYTGVEVVDKIRKGESLERAYLAGINLSKEDFRIKKDGGPCEESKPPGGFSLTDYPMCGACFRRAIIREVNLERTRLEQADFLGATISRANLNNVVLEMSYLPRTEFYSSKFNDANLKLCVLYNAVFMRCNLENAAFIKNGMTEVEIFNCNLNNAKLKGSDFSKSKIVDCDLTNADISGANFYLTKKIAWKTDNIICTHVYECPNFTCTLYGECAYEDNPDNCKYRHNFKNIEEINTFLHKESESKTQSLRANRGWKPTEECKKLTEEYVNDCLNKSCTCNHDEVRDFLLKKFEGRKPPFEEIMSLEDYNMSRHKQRRKDFITQGIMNDTVKKVYRDNGLKGRIKGCITRGAYSASHEPCPIHSK